MDNVIAFAKRKPDEEQDPVRSFVYDILIPWAEENGVDTSSQEFKFDAATIMTCLQGMLL